MKKSENSASTGTGSARSPTRWTLGRLASTVRHARTPGRRARSRRQSPTEGFEAPLERQRYYHGLLPRSDIEEMLRKEGDFLVRKTDKDNAEKLAISLRWKSKFRHLLVQRSSTGLWYLEVTAFKTIPELITFHRTNKRKVTTDGALLGRPIERKDWQFNHEELKLTSKLGEGAFGEVWKAQLETDSKPFTVAVKRLRKPDKTPATKPERQQFMAEARLMRSYKHDNIVRVFGVAAQEEPLMIIMEIMPGGSLLGELRKQAAQMSVRTRLRYCLEAAAGMRYLDKHNCIHRDVAARNCLIGERDDVKISDFGLTLQQREYKVSALHCVPVKWLAPETLREFVYSSKTDVWSFGVLMYEVFSGGGDPYPGLSNLETRERILRDSYRMEPPGCTPVAVSRLLYDCWLDDSSARPDFEHVHSVLRDQYRRAKSD